MLTTFSVVLVLNALWFGAAFRYFSLQSSAAAKILIPREERNNAISGHLAWSLKFLGGMNFAFAAASLAVLGLRSIFPTHQQNGVFAAIFALAHFSQFIFNLPLALQERTGKPLWNVLRGPMLFIFVVDALLALINTVCSIMLFLA